MRWLTDARSDGTGGGRWDNPIRPVLAAAASRCLDLLVPGGLLWLGSAEGSWRRAGALPRLVHLRLWVWQLLAVRLLL